MKEAKYLLVVGLQRYVPDGHIVVSTCSAADPVVCKGLSGKRLEREATTQRHVVAFPSIVALVLRPRPPNCWKRKKTLLNLCIDFAYLLNGYNDRIDFEKYGIADS